MCFLRERPVPDRKEYVRRMMKMKSVFAAAVVTLALSSPCAASAPARNPSSFTGNLLKITQAADFEAGQMKGLTMDPDIGDGALLLEEGRLSGVFESDVYECDSFENMVACWNAAVYEGSEVEVYARARYDDKWTKYLTWGVFTPFKERGSHERKADTCAVVDQDTFCMADDLTADAVQMKVVLRRDEKTDSSPVVRMLSMTFSGGDMKPAYAEDPLEELPDSSLIEAPAVAQLIRAPQIAKDICSPTVMTVLLNSRDQELNLLPEEYALNVRDEEEEIFGSWSFSVAGAGLYGFEAYPQFCDKDILLQELAKGHTIGINVRYTNRKDSDYPYMDGVFDQTGGHLICLIGYEYEDGIQDDEHLYFYSSDSFGEADKTSYRRYQWSRLKDCMGGMAYVIPDNKAEVTGEYAPGIMRKTLKLERDAKRDGTWVLKEDGKEIDMDRFINGSGILAFTAAGSQEADPVVTDHSVSYEKAVFTLANQPFCYNIICRKDGSLVFDPEAVRRILGVEDPDSELTLMAVSDRGVVYEAKLEDS